MEKRIVFLDYVRVFACLLVILVHASENFYPGPASTDMAGPVALIASEADRLWVSVYDGFSRISVPLFMIVSAFLLAPMPKGMTAGQFYRKRFGKILPPFLIFSVLYSTLPLLWGQIDIGQSLRDLSYIPLNFPSLAGHFWFMFPLISLYLFIPIISPWLEKCSKNEERFFILLFLISTCIPFLNRWVGEVWGQCFWNQYHMLWYFSGYLGYLVLAHYIKTRLEWSTAKRLWAGAIMLTAGAVVTILSFYLQAVPGIEHETPALEIAWTFCTLNVVCATTGAFIMFSCINTKKTSCLILSLSKLSFGIFLVHIFWLHLWAGIFMNTLPLPSVAAIPLMTACTFVSSAITVKLISLVPGSRWLIGA